MFLNVLECNEKYKIKTHLDLYSEKSIEEHDIYGMN
jgi:hypothetical protein